MILTLYHGTSARHRDSIEKHGLRPRRGKGNYPSDTRSHPYVYLTRYWAMFYALHAMKNKERPLLVRTEINIAELYPDEDFVAQVMAARQKKSNNMEWMRKIALKCDPADHQDLAQHSYELMGNVCAKRIPRNLITHIVEVETENFMDLCWLGADTNYSSCVGPLSELIGGKYAERLELLCLKGWGGVRASILKEQEERRIEIENTRTMLDKAARLSKRNKS